MNKKIIAIVAFIVLTVVLWWRFGGTPEVEAGFYDQFAQCLADKKITMYGAAWCPHCQNEKAAFGDSFRLVPYVECPEHIAECTALGIQGYPTWIFSGGKRLQGEQGLEKLSQESGCQLQEKSSK